MDTSLSRALTKLDQRALLVIGDGRGKGIALFTGALWITQENDLHDHFLDAGQTLVFQRKGKVVVQALATSGLLVFGAEPARNESRYDAALDRLVTPFAAGGSGVVDSHQVHRQARRMRVDAMALAVTQVGAALQRSWQQWRRALAGAGTLAPRRSA